MPDAFSTHMYQDEHEGHHVEEQMEAALGVVMGGQSLGNLIGLDADDLARVAQLGIASFAAAQYSRAELVFDALARLRPDLYLPHQYLGMIYETRAELERAAIAYSEAVTRIPPNAKALSTVLDDILFLL